MTDVVSIQFRGRGKTYYFDPNGLAPVENAPVIVETAKGLEYGICVRPVHSVADDAVVQPLRPVVRIATDADNALFAANAEKEKHAFDVCTERIAAHGLDMKLVDVEYGFDGSKILFFFTSDGRVDFRALVKDLAAIFRTRIELRQIGVRDGAKMLGGLGICGRPFCCSTFLDDFQPVSIKMAKSQNLSLNPAKISGTCGRLMCCLKYEQEAYEYLIRSSPKEGSTVDTPAGKGVITDLNLLRRTARVRLDDPNETTLQTFPLSRLGYTLNGSYVEPEPEPEPEYVLETSFSSEASDDAARSRRPGRHGDRNRHDGERRAPEAAKGENRSSEKQQGRPEQKQGGSSEHRGDGRSEQRRDGRSHGRHGKHPDGQKPKQGGKPEGQKPKQGGKPEGQKPQEQRAEGARAEGSKPQQHRHRHHRGGGQHQHPDGNNGNSGNKKSSE